MSYTILGKVLWKLYVWVITITALVLGKTAFY